MRGHFKAVDIVTGTKYLAALTKPCSGASCPEFLISRSLLYSVTEILINFILTAYESVLEMSSKSTHQKSKRQLCATPTRAFHLNNIYGEEMQQFRIHLYCTYLTLNKSLEAEP